MCSNHYSMSSKCKVLASSELVYQQVVIMHLDSNIFCSIEAYISKCSKIIKEAKAGKRCRVKSKAVEKGA